MPTIAEAREQWTPAGVYLNTASYGLPARDGFDAMQQALADWRAGATSWEHWGESSEGSRDAFARMVNTTPDRIAIGATVSEFMGMAAASLPKGTNVLVPDVEFTSTLFPFLVQEARGVTVTTVPPERLAEAIDATTDVVAFSAVQMSTGRGRRHRRDHGRGRAPRREHDPRRDPGVRLAADRRDPRRRGHVQRLQVADVAARHVVHGRRRRLARADRPAQRGLVRGRGRPSELLRTAAAPRHRRAPLRHLAGVVLVGWRATNPRTAQPNRHRRRIRPRCGTCKPLPGGHRDGALEQRDRVVRPSRRAPTSSSAPASRPRCAADGVRVSWHVYNTDAEVDATLDALVLLIAAL